MISSGMMDQRVTPLFPMYSGRSAMGAQTVVWKQLSPRWARVQYAKGTKVLDAGETFLDQEIVVTMYYNAVVTERCRLVWQDRKYEILSLNGTRRDGTLTIRARRIDEGNADAEVVTENE